MKKLFKHLIPGLAALLLLVFAACSAGGGEVGGGGVNNTKDIAGLVAAAGDSEVVLTWEDPDYDGFDHVEITWDNGGGSIQSVIKGIGTYTAAGLSNSTEYTFTVRTADDNGRKSAGVTIKSTPDEAVPLNVSGLTSVRTIRKVVLNWTDPADNNFDHVEITWEPGGSAVQTVAGGIQTFTASDIADSTSYTFTIKSVDKDGDISAGVAITVTPTVEVLELAATSVNGGMVLNWNDPGYGDFDHVEITWSPDGSTIQTVDSGEKTFTALGLTNGTEYTFTVKTVDASNNKSDGITISSKPDHQYFAYIADGSNVSVFKVDPVSGALSILTSGPYGAGEWPRFITVDRTGKFIYVSNYYSKSISAYVINPVTGGLTEISGSPLTTVAYPRTLATDPSGKFLYVVNQNINQASAVSVYSINSSTGALTEISGSPSSECGRDAMSIVIDSSGKFAYVLSYSQNNYGTIYLYSINSTTGALTFLNSTIRTSGYNTFTMSIHPNNKFIYVPNYASNNVSVFSIDATTGALTEISGSPFAISGTGANSLTFSPDGNFAYVANSGSNNISVCSVNLTNGALTENISSKISAGEAPDKMAFDPTGKFFYAANSDSYYDDNISGYTLNSSTGALTEMAGSPFDCGSYYQSHVYSADDIVIVRQ